MRRGRNKKGNSILVLLIIIVGIAIGAAALETRLNINGKGNMVKPSWDIYWDNVQVSSGSVSGDKVVTEAHVMDDTTEVEYAVNLKIGEYYEFTVDAVNNGSVDAMIAVGGINKEVYNSDGTTKIEPIPKYIKYTVTYANGAELEEKHLLAKKTGDTPTRETYKVRVEFGNDLELEDLENDSDISFKFSVDYIQADEESKKPMTDPTVCAANQNQTVRTGAICKRAVNLHTEKCEQTDGTGCAASGETDRTIIYGNCGTIGSKLQPGDALDCDVNGNGQWERFYYVSDYFDTSDGSWNKRYATLIYYSNVLGGKSNNTQGIAYQLDNYSFYGPTVGYLELPNSDENGWSNIELYTNTRQILNEKGEKERASEILKTFEYTNKAARLLTIQELNKACSTRVLSLGVGVGEVGEFDKCEYLMENTSYINDSYTYGYWLENPISFSAGISVFSVFGSFRNMVNLPLSNGVYGGIRPAIDVPLSKISY